MSADDDLERETVSASPGDLLAAGRAAEMLTVAEAARHLKLSVAQVEALEAGEFDRLPGPVFVRGFVRNYARLLKLDPEELLRRIEPELGGRASSPEAPPSKDIPFPPPAPRRWPVFALLALIVVVLLAVHEFYWSERPLAPPGLIAPTPLRVERPPTVSANEKMDASPAAANPVSVDPGEPVLPLPAAPDKRTMQEVAPLATKEMAQEAATPVPAATPVVASHGVVHLQFDDEAWVEIRDRSGKTIFSQLNASGTEKRVRGAPPLALVIGNAHGVRVSYNDRPVDLTRYTRVDIARLVLE